ncbi:MAG: asparagine synthase (glutamine-hydrolyzing) [Cytophagales bacterium]|nr:asparagine synthase (glutamine-hydrolyzing) [Cytophagales bacterium]
MSRMSEATRHRGPDETCTKIINGDSYHYHLSANRLAITDQSDNAAQPFHDEASKCALLFNGEIYNYYELRNDLIAQNISFNSFSDTEVLFHWIKTYGPEGLKKLEGMFAFIFINFENEEVFVARDRFGIKPIYFYQNERFIIISSEIKAIVRTGLIKKVLNRNQLFHYLSYKYARPPETFYKDVYELEHGHYLRLHRKGSENKKFIDEKKPSIFTTPDIKKVEELITDSLLKQLNAGVPLGLLLSGGVDSTLLLALAQKEGYKLPTYSVVNTKKENSFGTNDRHYSRLASSIYACDHHELEIDIGLLDQFDDSISKMDQPIGDSSYLLTSEICRYASDSMKILLSGAGADELFAGYNRHWAFYKYLNNKSYLNILTPLAKRFINVLPTGYKHPLRKKFRLLKKWAKSYDGSSQATFNNYLIFNEIGAETLIKDKDERVDYRFGWALKNDQNNYLVGDVLALSDKASMLHGIELRVPYLSEHLTNYLNTFNPEERIRYGRKWMLKRILANHGGKKIAGRSKEGFGMPLSDWILNKKAMHLWNNFSSEDNPVFEFIEKEKIEMLIQQQKRKVEDHGPLLWSMLVLSHWIKQHF